MEEISDKAALEAFVIENDDLEKLEDLLQEVNLFEAIGAARSEQRHSDFLAFLLDPSNAHGLGDIFLKRLLQRGLALSKEAQSAGISPVYLDTWDLNDTVVYRERDNIDILIINEEHKIAFVIENKISTQEHSNQLARYRELIGRQHPDCRVCHLFLNYMGDEPSDTAYIHISYKLVVEILDRILVSRHSSLGGDIQVLIRHYIEMVRRNLVEESKLSELAKSIYLKHRRALDLIFEHRPDLQSDLGDFIQRHIENAGLLLDHCTKAFIRFTVPEWDEIEGLRRGNGWTPTGRLMLFEVKLRESAQLALIIGPGDASARQRVWTTVQEHRASFKPVSRSLTDKWATIWSRQIISKTDFADGDLTNLSNKFVSAWDNFLLNDLPRMKGAIGSAT